MKAGKEHRAPLCARAVSIIEELQQTNYPREVAEMALTHTVSDKVEATYRRGDLFEKQSRIMEDWAKYCNTTSAMPGDVIPINKAAKST